jgi:hypothetical protein
VQDSTTNSTVLEYRRANNAAHGRVSIAWVITAIVAAALPAMVMARSTPLFLRAALIVLGAGAAATCVLMALRAMIMRWWALLLLLGCIPLSVSALIAVGIESFLWRSTSRADTALAPDIARGFPIVAAIAGFAWIAAIALIKRLGWASVPSRRAKTIALPILILAWVALSLENAAIYGGMMLFGGTIIARGASPDGQHLALVERHSFLDTSYMITLQRNSVFAIHAERIGGPGFDGAGPLGAPSITWSADSRIVELRLGDEEPCFRYDTVARRELP